MPASTRQPRGSRASHSGASDAGSDKSYASSGTSSTASSFASSSSMATADLPQLHPRKRVAPQEAIDSFWANFTTKTPGKATTVIPQTQYAAKVVSRKTAKAALSPPTSTTTQTSYDDAAAMCRAKVEKIVRECRRVNRKYRDPHFDIEMDLKLNRRECLQSLSNNKSPEATPPGYDLNPKSAKRVVDIFDKPQFYIEGPTANDVRQGRDGDCWLMSALCTLSNKKGLIEKLCVAHDMNVGVYGFVFFRDGDWISEIVDDFLYLTKPDYDEGFTDRMLFDELERNKPEEAYRRIYQSNSTSLYFAQCEHPQETWLPLLEKAYAKSHGDYAAIEGGFGGEGIEDLTGGCTTELLPADILDKEHFWKEELLKVNDDFLFTCSTGLWGFRYFEDTSGIVSGHAYSVQRAVEIDGKRLLLMKNPWGKHEWKGAWSDGSKEWTSEWLQKLDHRFGDDGDFWISYEDILRKYQEFERTRLFGDDWRVSQIWTTLAVPWMLDYHDTHFSLTISRPGPVVIVLNQLDDRYYRGLQGQYRFQIAFRVHKAGHEDYIVRSQVPFVLRRSVNVELDLEEGEYHIRFKVDARRDEDVLPIEQVVKNSAKKRREKLTRVGLSYDLAHAKGKLIETPEERDARKQHDKKGKDNDRKEYKRKFLNAREEDHYLKVQDWKREQKKHLKRKEKMRAKKEAMKAKKEAKRREMGENEVEVKKEEDETKGVDRALETVEETTEKKEESVKNEEGNVDEKAVKQEDEETVAVAVAVADVKEVEKQEDAQDKDTPGTSDQSEERHPEEGGHIAEETECESESEDDLASIASLSTLSDRELDIGFEANQQAQSAEPQPQQPDEQFGEEADPWNAVVVIGLRVYHKIQEEDGLNEVVKLGVIRPNPYDEEEEGDEGEDGSGDKGEKVDGDSRSRGLDVDDSAKDATLVGGIREKRKSVLGTMRRR